MKNYSNRQSLYCLLNGRLQKYFSGIRKDSLVPVANSLTICIKIANFHLVSYAHPVFANSEHVIILIIDNYQPFVPRVESWFFIVPGGYMDY
jgi:hypothetical protein